MKDSIFFNLVLRGFGSQVYSSTAGARVRNRLNDVRQDIQLVHGAFDQQLDSSRKP